MRTRLILTMIHVMRGLFVGLLMGLMSSSGASAAQPEYKLSVGDVLSFDLADDEELPRELAIGSDGQVAVPLLGNVPVAGLTISQASNAIREGYIGRQLYVDPRLSLSIASFRQIFVLGDVKSPGAYPYRPNLTVEQAIGLAGGPATVVGNVEDRILQRTKLEADLRALEGDVSREAAVFARLSAQIEGRLEISSEDIPKLASPLVDARVFESLRPGEETILEAEKSAFEDERKQLLEAIQEVNNGLAVLNDLVSAQKKTIGFTQEDLARKAGLLKKGLNTAGDVSVLQRQLATDEARLLAIYAQMSDGRRNIANLKRELGKLESTRKKTALVERQEKQSTIDKLVASRKVLADQLYFLTNWTSEAGQQKNQGTISYQIRRNQDSSAEQEPASGLSRLLPGDVVLVSIERPIVDPTLPAPTSSTVSGATLQRQPNGPAAGTQLVQ